MNDKVFHDAEYDTEPNSHPFPSQVREDHHAIADIIRTVGKMASWMITLIPIGNRSVNGQEVHDDSARNQPNADAGIRRN